MLRPRWPALFVLSCVLLAAPVARADIPPPPTCTASNEGSPCTVGSQTGTCKSSVCVPNPTTDGGHKDAGQPPSTKNDSGCVVAASSPGAAPVLLSLLVVGLWLSLRRRRR